MEKILEQLIDHYNSNDSIKKELIYSFNEGTSGPAVFKKDGETNDDFKKRADIELKDAVYKKVSSLRIFEKEQHSDYHVDIFMSTIDGELTEENKIILVNRALFSLVQNAIIGARSINTIINYISFK